MNSLSSHELAILNSPTASFWLKNALTESLNRDPLDAWRDAKILAELLKARFQKIVNKQI